MPPLVPTLSSHSPYPLLTSAAPGLLLGCFWAAPGLLLGYSWAAAVAVAVAVAVAFVVAVAVADTFELGVWGSAV